jgi:hypothetical protein
MQFLLKIVQLRQLPLTVAALLLLKFAHLRSLGSDPLLLLLHFVQ